MKYCEIRYEPREWLVTVFPDGTEWGAYPHDTHHYHVISHRCGYGDDIWAYCFEHEFCHSFISEYIADKPSYVVSRLAARIKPDMAKAVAEEALTQTFQRWMRAAERPILSGIDWDHMRFQAISKIASSGHASSG